MTTHQSKGESGALPLSRRSALRAAAAVGTLAAAPEILAAPSASASATGASTTASSAATSGAASSAQPSPLLWRRPARLGAPPNSGLHLTFGADPAREMTVSWSTAVSVADPRVRYGTPEDGFGVEVRAETVTYIDAESKIECYIHHAKLTGLRPNTTYIYAVLADGVLPDAGSFETAPAGRAPFTFTSFGDQAVPGSTWAVSGNTYTAALATLAAPSAADVVDGIEQVRPLFHLHNGDLSYASLSADRVRTWNEFFTNNERSARRRPWMPAPGNHENELGNGAIGYESFRTRFAVPGNGSADFEGLWYAFTVGGVRVIVLANDDVALQDSGDTYVNGYSGGQQKSWLERQLAAARGSRDIDWIVVCMHHVVVSSANANGADLGVRQNWGPLFDKYEVDLVVCGHEHDYERSYALRGTVSGSETLTPNPVSTERTNIDTEQGTVHMVLGGGGNSYITNTMFFGNGQAKVLTAVSGPVPGGKRTPTYVMEDAIWSAFRDEEHPYGFAAFDVDPGSEPGGSTSIRVTYYNVLQPYGGLEKLETFTLYRRRADG